MGKVVRASYSAIQFEFLNFAFKVAWRDEVT